MPPTLTCFSPEDQVVLAVSELYRSTSVKSILDWRGDVRRLTVDGQGLVAKRRPQSAAVREHRQAETAYQRLSGLRVPGIGKLAVVVPHLIRLDDSQHVLITPFLGDPLASAVTAGESVPLPVLIEALRVALRAGVDAPGFVPRNLFLHSGTVSIIDWEDVRFGDRPLAPSRLSLMKWDIAWSDVYLRDPQLRRVFEPAAPVDDVEPDAFELTLAEFLPTPGIVRDVGMDATLGSELHVDGVAGGTAAMLGHLAEDVLSPRVSVFHTMLTALVRDERGEAAYAALIDHLWHQLPAGSGHFGLAVRSGWWAPAAVWSRALCSMADHYLGVVEKDLGQRSLRELGDELAGLADGAGWDAGLRRAALAEAILRRITALVTRAFALTGLTLLLRGSLAQGILGCRSDVDFELSSPRYRHGHRPAERLIVELLASYGLPAEGSQGRPEEADLVGADPAIRRDLHEWMELRQPGADVHDPGWLRELLAPDRDQLCGQPSEYERRGREHTAKYLWFEVRALVARLVFRELPAPPPNLVKQLSALPELVPAPLAEELTAVVLASFRHREQPTAQSEALAALRERVDSLRSTLALPGPVSLPDPAMESTERESRG